MSKDFLWLRANGWLSTFREGSSELDAMVRALGVLRESGGVGKAVALASLSGHLLEFALPSDEPGEMFERHGWTPVAEQRSVAALVLRLLRARVRPERIKLSRRQGASLSPLELWRIDGVPAVASFKEYDHLQILERRPGDLRALLAQIWDEASAWAVAGQWSTRQSWSQELHLLPLAPVSTPPLGPEADALRRWVSGPSTGRTRVVLIVGPTGAGKTTLARTALGQTRTLQLPAKDVEQSTMMELAELLQPDVVLVDDIVLGNDGLDQAFSGLLDRIQGRVPLVMATFMADDLTEQSAGKPGGLYWPGMRAGRLDRVVFLPPPQAPARRAILAHYGARPDDLDTLVRATEGLTGAFLRELVVRTHQAPQVPLLEHVRQLRCMAPKAFSAPREVQAEAAK